MDKLWNDGWQAGFDWSYNNSSFSVYYDEKDGKKVYTGSFKTVIKNSGQELMDRSDLFQRGYREGLSSGSGRKWDETKADIMKKLGIIDPFNK